MLGREWGQVNLGGGIDGIAVLSLDFTVVFFATFAKKSDHSSWGPYNTCPYGMPGMENSETNLPPLQVTILDGMADDYEDVEQLYLYANRVGADEEHANIQFPRMLVEVVVHLRDLVDEITSMLHEGYIEAKYSNDEEVAPLNPVNLALLHHYWFGATDKGTELWKARSKDSNDF
jgi:hypothetical protein